MTSPSEAIAQALSTPPPWLTFDDEDHRYYVDGVRVRGVTSVMSERGFGIDFDNIHPAALKNIRLAGARSKIVHAAFVEFYMGILDVEGVPDEAAPQLAGVLRVADRIGLVPIVMEKMLVSRELSLGGIPDCAGIMRLDLGGIHAIVDIKCTYKVSDYVALQLTAYRELVNRTLVRNGIEPIDWKLYVIHVPKSGVGKLVPIEPDLIGFEHVFEAAA